MPIRPINLFSNFKTAKAITTKPRERRNADEKTNASNKKIATIMGGYTALSFRGKVSTNTNEGNKTTDKTEVAPNNTEVTIETVNSFAENTRQQADEAVEYVQKQIDKILGSVQAQELYNEVTELFKKGAETASNGVVLRKIIDEGPNRKMMKEYDEEGFVMRISLFKDDSLYMIANGIKQRYRIQKKYAFDKHGFLIEIPIYEEVDKNPAKIEDTLFFDKNGKLDGYRKNVENFSTTGMRFERELLLENGIPSEYTEDYCSSIVRKPTAAKKFLFDKDGRLKQYIEDYKQLLLRPLTCNYAKSIAFEDGKLSCCKEGYNGFYSGAENIAKVIYFSKDGTPYLYQEDYKRFKDGSESSAREFRAPIK